MNPMRLWKLLEHVKLFLVTSAGALFVAMAGLKDGLGRLAPLYTYTVLAAAVWLATSPKIGSDSNYQIEAGLLIALCAACALDRFECFPRLFAGSMAGILLLLLPLTVNVYTNLLVCRNTITRRVSRELQHRAKDAEIARFLPPGRGPVLSTDFDPVLQFHGRIDVEPFIYAQLVDAGLVDPTPVLADLQARRFSTVILFRNVFAPRARWENEETVSLTDAQMQAVRTNYRLVGHLKGPYLEGDYIYAPRQ